MCEDDRFRTEGCGQASAYGAQARMMPLTEVAPEPRLPRGSRN